MTKDVAQDRNYMRQLNDEDLLARIGEGSSELEIVLAERLDLALSQIPDTDD